MRKKQKNIMTYIACLYMIARMFPVFGVWAEEELRTRYESSCDRHNGSTYIT